MKLELILCDLYVVDCCLVVYSLSLLNDFEFFELKTQLSSVLIQKFSTLEETSMTIMIQITINILLFMNLIINKIYKQAIKR